MGPIIYERAYAKINLYLDIIKKNEDGYHDIVTIMQLVSLYDEIEIELIDRAPISVEVTNADLGIPQEKNLAYIAAEKFYDYLPYDPSARPHIKIKKNIPVASGLAGGSADAAAVLRGLNKRYKNPFTTKKLCEIALTIGSDVPFCVVGGTQVCQNRGEIVFGHRGINHYNLLIAKAENKLSTAEQYRLLDEKFNNFQNYRYAIGYGETLSSYAGGRCRDAFAAAKNIFDELYDSESSVQKLKRFMIENEAYYTFLTGSGPSVVGVFPDSIYAEDVQELLNKRGIESYLCLPIGLEYEEMIDGKDPWWDY